MKKVYSTVILFLIVLTGYAGTFTAGNIVIVRIGTGTAALGNTATAVFLDEYTTDGVFVQSIPMPTATSGPNFRLTNSGSATSEGSINLSTNRLFLTVAGYDADLGTAGVASTTTTVAKRVIGIIDENGSINTSTGITDAFSGNNIRAAVTTNGTDLWTVGGTSGVRYTTTGSATTTQLSTTPTNIRNVGIYNGQLYVASSTANFYGVSSVGTNTPTTSGQVTTLLPGFPTATGPSTYAFDLKPVAGDTLYVADDRTISPGGIQKWVLNGGNWTLAYTIVPAAGVGARGLTVDWNTRPATIYATGTNNVLYRITDNYNAAASTSAVLVTAATNTALRGVAFAPGTMLLPLKLLSFTASAKNNSTIVNWKTASETNTSRFELEQSINGRDFHTIATITAAGNSSVERSYSFTGNLNSTTTYYRLKMIDADSKFTTSSVIQLAASTNGFTLGNVYPVPAKNKLTIEWNSNHAGKTAIVVTDISGRTMHNASVQAAEGFNQFILDVQSLRAGQYFISLKNETNQLQTIIIRQ